MEWQAGTQLQEACPVNEAHSVGIYRLLLKLNKPETVAVRTDLKEDGQGSSALRRALQSWLTWKMAGVGAGGWNPETSQRKVLLLFP